jgi:hypothetical protein
MPSPQSNFLHDIRQCNLLEICRRFGGAEPALLAITFADCMFGLLFDHFNLSETQKQSEDNQRKGKGRNPKFVTGTL